MRLFRHQPLLIWSIVLVCLTALTVVGASGLSSAPTVERVVPAQRSGGPAARDLLSRTQGAYAALAAGQLPAWAASFADDAADAAAPAAGTVHEAAWADVVAAARNLDRDASAPRETVLVRLSELQRAVMDLVRTYP